MKARSIWDNGGVSNPSEVVAFLRARLDHEESLAKAASGSAWQPMHQMGVGEFVADEHGHAVARLWVDLDELADGSQPIGANALDTTKHIALHDPERVLAEVDAKRRVIREFEEARAEWEKWGNGEGTPTARQKRAEALGRLNAWSEALRLAALPYGSGTGD